MRLTVAHARRRHLFPPRFGLMTLLMVLTAFPGFSQEWYIDKPIQNITFTSLRHADISELQEVTDPYIGRIFTDTLYNELLSQLYALNCFESISATVLPADADSAQVIINIDVQEHPPVTGIYFEGNIQFPAKTTLFSRFTGDALSDVISLEKGDLVNATKLRVDEQAIRNRYLEEGFTEVSVHSEVRAGDSVCDVVFIIYEGKQTIVSKVNFRGNDAFSSDTLRDQLSMEKEPFQEAKLAEDKAAIVQYYHDRGYINAEVKDIARNTTLDGRSRKGNLSTVITFTVWEGERYTFGGISFEGNAIFSTGDLSARVQSKTGEAVNISRVRADFQRVSDAYYDLGYIYNTLTEEAVRDDENRVYSLVVHITEHPQQARVGNIIVRGNEKTKTEVILREIPLRPGDIYSKRKFMEGLQNLYALQYFSSITPETPHGEADGLLDLVINVEEQSTEAVMFGLTLLGSSGTAPDPRETVPFRGTIEWHDSNLGGTGNKLLFGAKASVNSMDYQSFTVQYTQGWLFDKRFPLTLDLSVIHQKTWTAIYDAGFTEEDIADEDNQKEYERFPASVGISTGHTWQTAIGGIGLAGGLRSGVEYDDITFTTYDPLLRDSDVTMINSVWAALSLDTRDISHDPSCGYYGIQRASYYGIVPADRERYLRTDTKLEGFITFLKIPVSESYTWKAVFGVHSGLAFILPQPGRELAIEITHKPSVDGMFTGRGWAQYAFHYGGRVLFENWAEIRLPVIPEALALDFFLDAAAVSATPNSFFHDFTTDDFLYSCGAGLRIVSSGFPLRFLVAKRFLMRNGNIYWQDGPFFKNNKPNSGVNLVLCFVLSSY